ncbi:ABC transporter ATP-binding protein/permease [Desulfosarcina sp. OttesenSCG-928-G10]|nr:ABC transporter ATP-binding protein/permease [Desulfosarcina sp. OttesenSCG-928-G10]
MLSAGGGFGGALPFLVPMALFCLMDAGCRWNAHNFDYSGTLADVTHDLRKKLGEKLSRMPHAPFRLSVLHRFRTGELNAILAGNVEDAVMPLGVTGSLMLQTVVVPLAILVFLVFTDPVMGICFAGLMLPAFPVYVWRRKMARTEFRELSRFYADVESDVVEYIQGLSDLKALDATGSRALRLRHSVENLYATQIAHQKQAARPSLIMASIVEIGLLVVLGVGVYRVLGDALALSLLAGMIVVISRLSEPLAIFIHITPVFDMMETAFSRIRGLLSIPALPVPEKPEKPENWDVSFDHVRFSYDADEPDGDNPAVLADVSFTLPEGAFTALVGPSGAGKTTITRLLMRYADPESGAIRIGGVDIRGMDQTTLMSCFSVVFQDVYLFNDSILNNIRMGKPDADDAAVRKAAESAFCHEFITRLPLGYDTKVGDIGGSLSGGERQRISIARAILKDAPIVILDEPTSALDTESERAVQKAMDALVKNRSLIVIAHRLSTIQHADTILFIESSRIVEKGAHGDLMEKKGRYYALWQAQQRIKAWEYKAQIVFKT